MEEKKKPRRKSGPKPKYGPRKDLHVWLDVDLAAAVEQVASEGVAVYLSELLRKQPEIIAVLEKQPE